MEFELDLKWDRLKEELPDDNTLQQSEHKVKSKEIQGVITEVCKKNTSESIF